MNDRVVIPFRHRNSVSFGYVVVGWVKGRDLDLSAPFETYGAAEEFLGYVEVCSDHCAWIARAEDPSRAEILKGELVAAAEKRIYAVKTVINGLEKVEGVDASTTRLVKAQNPAQAIRHVAKGTISALIPKPEELLELGGKGIKVEEVSENA